MSAQSAGGLCSNTPIEIAIAIIQLYKVYLHRLHPRLCCVGQKLLHTLCILISLGHRLGDARLLRQICLFVILPPKAVQQV